MAEKVPEGLRILALCWLCMGVLAGTLIKFPKYYQHKRHDDRKKSIDIANLETVELHIDLDPYFVLKLMDVGFQMDTFQQQQQQQQKDHNDSASQSSSDSQSTEGHGLRGNRPIKKIYLDPNEEKVAEETHINLLRENLPVSNQQILSESPMPIQKVVRALPEAENGNQKKDSPTTMELMLLDNG